MNWATKEGALRKFGRSYHGIQDSWAEKERSELTQLKQGRIFREGKRGRNERQEDS